MNRNKVKGMLLGTAIGDALGMPVETWDSKKIYKYYPEGIQKYEKPDHHKWFKGEEAGVVTDDTQLTIAVLTGMIKAADFDQDFIAMQHVEAMKDSTAGWGTTTKDAIRNLANGVHWSKSGQFPDSGKVRGLGNGVPMKISPLAAFRLAPGVDLTAFNRNVVTFSAMSHYSQISAFASVFHVQMLVNCLEQTPEDYDLNESVLGEIDYIFGLPTYPGLPPSSSEAFEIDFLQPVEDCYETILYDLKKVIDEDWSYQKIAEHFKGTCYVYHSLPYVYAHWMKDNLTIDTIFNCINHAGERSDTDSNASMLGAMLGALHGVEIFESRPDLIEGLNCYNMLMDLADEFCDVFNI